MNFNEFSYEGLLSYVFVIFKNNIAKTYFSVSNSHEIFGED